MMWKVPLEILILEESRVAQEGAPLCERCRLQERHGMYLDDEVTAKYIQRVDLSADGDQQRNSSQWLSTEV